MREMREKYPIPNAQCPMPNAQCPMPNAQCPMPNAPCPMPNTQCPASQIAAGWLLELLQKSLTPLPDALGRGDKA
jgi:hypothetical protein